MKSKKTREKILDVSLELFNSKKASNVSTVQISTAMGISPGNLYYYFANKEEVIRCIWTERMLPIQEANIEKIKEAETVDDLVAFIESNIRYMVDYIFFYTEKPTLFVNDNKLIDLYINVQSAVNEELKKLCLSWIKNGNFKNLDEETTVIYMENCISTAYQTLSDYSVYMAKGESVESFIELTINRTVQSMKPLLNDESF